MALIINMIKRDFLCFTTEKMNIFGSQRKIRYRISDSVLNFYYSYMADDIERIRIGFGIPP